MAQLQSTNVTGVLCVNGVAVGGGKDFKFCCFESTTTWTPSSDLVDGNGFIEADVVGAGGGGGGSAQRSKVPANACCTTTGGRGAGGGFIRDLITIDSTATCTVTVGAGGTAGWVSGSYTSNVNYLDIFNAMNDTNIIPGGDGGNSVFGGITAYGGCGGSSTGMSTNSDGTNANSRTCICTISGVVTDAGTYGGFRGNLGDCSRTLCFNASTGCGDNTRGDIAGIGVEGSTWNRRCSTYPGYTADSNTLPDASPGSGTICMCTCQTSSVTYGNGGSGNCIKSYSNFNYQDFGSNGTRQSGSYGQPGIIVLKWQE